MGSKGLAEFCDAETLEKIVRIKHLSSHKNEDIFQIIDLRGLKGTFVNRACPSLQLTLSFKILFIISFDYFSAFSHEKIGGYETLVEKYFNVSRNTCAEFFN